MATKTDIFNLALSHLGAQKIGTDTESSAPAEILRTNWNNVRRAVLRKRSWNFASTPAVLSEVSSVVAEAGKDVYGYAHAWQLPSDYISIFKFNGIETGTTRACWKVTEPILYANDTEAKLEYIRDETDCTRWPDDFVNAVSWFLAAAVAPSMSSDPKLGLNLLGVAEASLGSAQAADSDQEGKINVLTGLGHSAYLAARRGMYGPSDDTRLNMLMYGAFHPEFTPP